MTAFENFVSIEGNLATQPEMRQLPSGDAVCNLVLATNERLLVDGQWTDGPVSYFDAPAYAHVARQCTGLKMGDRVSINGKLKQRTWVDKTTGEKHYKVEITVKSISDSRRFVGTAPRGQMAQAVDAEPFE